MGPLRSRPWHQSELLTPYRFFDVQGLHQSAAKGHSLINVAELQVAMQLYERLTTDFRGCDLAGKIGIITPYKGQLREMKTRFAARYGNDIFSMVDFNTTDAFQGRESEVIIFSCVRASNKGIGFLADIRRMNVGLTRAKSSLWVLGNSQSLVQGEFWNSLITNARSRNVYTDGDVLKLLERPQFTGYKNVEMTDADAPERLAPSRTPSAMSVSRPPSVSLGNLPSESPSHSVSASGKGTPPVPLPEGPSGGGNGLDENRMCGYCGSYAHMTPHCDNIDAKETSQGKCHRCGGPGHRRYDCTVERCVECGDVGHLSSACANPNTLPKKDKVRISREEYNHAQVQKQKSDRQRQKQLGGHDPKVPAIQVSNNQPPNPDPKKSQSSSKNDGSGPGKRKRPESPPSDNSKARPRKSNQGGPPSAPKGGRNRLDANVPTNPAVSGSCFLYGT